MNLHMEWYDWIGMLGTLMVLLAFFLLQAGRVVGTGLSYQLLNLLGASGILVSLIGAFNPAVFMLELAWIAISAYGIARSIRLRRGRAPTADPYPPG
jgi:paired small multidrug resistance pump